jgi:hypothetical protein
MKTKAFLAVLLLLITFSAQSQVHRLGLQAGLDFTSARTPGNLPDSLQAGFENFQNLTNGSFGFFTEGGSNDFIITQIGIFYSGKGFKTTSYQARLHYFEVPLMFYFRVPIAGPVKLLTGFGPSAAIAFYGVEKNEGVKSSDILSFPKDNTSDNKFYNPFDIGINFGAKVEITLPQKKLLEVGVKYQLGIWKTTNLFNYGKDQTYNDITFDPKLKSNSLSITLAYCFDITKDNPVKK